MLPVRHSKREQGDLEKKANLLIVMAPTRTREDRLQQIGVHYLQVLDPSVAFSINCDSITNCDQCHSSDSFHFTAIKKKIL